MTITTHVDATPVGRVDVGAQDVPPAAPPSPLELDEAGRVVAVRVRPVSRFTPNEMAAMKAETGKTMSQMSEDEAEGMRMLVWITCRRNGKRVTWDEAGDIEMEFVTPQLDPTSGGSSTSEPPSVSTSSFLPPTSTT